MTMRNKIDHVLSVDKVPFGDLTEESDETYTEGSIPSDESHERNTNMDQKSFQTKEGQAGKMNHDHIN